MPDPADTPPPRFEEALAELDDILRELEDGTTTLDDALARYEHGVALLRQCYGHLRAAEQKVKLLAGFTEDGAAELKPFEHIASIEAANAAVRKPTLTSADSDGRGFPRQPPPDSGIRE
jgi:exodeoxyribonuclease VII small subunit